MSDNKDIADAYKESCDLAEKMITKQTEIIANQNYELALMKQRVLCQKKIIYTLKEQLDGNDKILVEFSK